MESRTVLGVSRSIFVGMLAAAFLVSGFFVPNAEAIVSNINLTSPNGGEVWNGTRNITWTAIGAPGDKVSILISDNNFVTSATLIDEIAYDAGFFNWDTTTKSDGTNYKIRVQAPSGDFDTSVSVFTVDNAAPTFTVNEGTDTGPVQTDIINVSVSDTMSGVAAREYGFGADAVCDGTDTYGNSFSSGVDFSIAGDHTDFLCLKATDNASNTGFALVGQLNTDNTAPNFAFYTLNGFSQSVAFHPGLVTISVTADEPVEWVSAQIYKSDNPSIHKNKQPGNDGTSSTVFDWDGSLSAGGPGPIDGIYNIKVHITDLAGNDAPNIELTPFTITVDTQNPTLPGITEPVADTVYKTDPPLVFMPSDGLTGVTCSYSIDAGGPVTVPCSSGVPVNTTIPDLSDGRHGITVTVTDGVGNSTTTSPISFVFDNNNTLTVGPSGSDFTTIQAAVNAATDGDTISIAAGSYSESIMINGKDLTLSGSGGVIALSFTLTDTTVSGSTNVTAPTVNVNSGAKIQDGVLLVSSGGTINVAAGTYSESIITCPGGLDAMFCIDKSLALVGDVGDLNVAGPGVNAPEIDGEDQNASAFVIGYGVSVSDVTIRGFEIHSFANPGCCTGGIGSGILAWNSNSSDVLIEYNFIHDVGWNGVLVGSDDGSVQSNWTIKRNIIDSADYAGIELTNVTNSEVAFNDITIGAGISWDPGDSGVGIEVAVRDHGTGVTAGNGVSVHNNEIIGDGVQPERAGINVLSRAYQATSNALLTGVTIENNTITGAERGIFVVAEARNGGAAKITDLTILGNTLDSNEEGLVIWDFVNITGTATHSGISIINNSITNSTGGASRVHILADTLAAGITLNNNNIAGNAGFGVNNEGVGVLDAKKNWWGSFRGPFHSTNQRGEGDKVSGNVDFSPWCTEVPVSGECNLGSNGLLEKLVLLFDPNPVTIPNASELTVAAVDFDGVTLVNDTRQIELNGGGTTRFDGISGPALLNLDDGVAQVDVTDTTPGTVNIVAKISGVPFGSGQIVFEAATIPAPTGITIDDVFSQPQNLTASATDSYLNGWRFTFRITVHNELETKLYIKFVDWENTANSSQKVKVEGNTRLLINEAGGLIAGVDLTDTDIQNGFGEVVSYGVANTWTGQTPPGGANLVGDLSSADGRQVQFEVFTKLPETTTPGAYTSTFDICTDVKAGTGCQTLELE